MTVKSTAQRDTGTSSGRPSIRRWCCRCEKEQPMKGGKMRPFFTCAACLAPKEKAK